ncbi:MAG TPA: transposase [Actinomycetes bacterium]|nr:transposase [Actinomycetes bacterium]
MPCAEQALSIADILRDHVGALHLDHEQGKAVAHILACRTGRLGGHVAFCDRCGARHYAYHSCRDRHCPRCGGLDQRLWAEAQLQHLLPVAYFHLVFTLPVSLRRFFAGQGRTHAFDALFAAVSESILQTAATRGLRPGVLAVLHTWNQLQGDHPHIHCLVTGGGLGPEGFVHCRRYLVPLKVLRRVFRGKLLSKLQSLLREQRVSVPRDSGHERLRDASRRQWNIDIRRPLGGPEQVVNYFARYVRKIAISDHRLVSYDAHTVTFRYRDRADRNRTKTAKVEASAFCRRFLHHVLPPRFVRIRRYGLLSNRVRQPLLQRCRQLLGAEPPLLLAPPGESRTAAIRRIFGVEPNRCPTCKLGTLIVRAQWPAIRLPLDAVLASLSPRAP